MTIGERSEEPLSWQAMAWRVVLAAALLATGYLLGTVRGLMILEAAYAVSLLAIAYKDVHERRVPNLIVYPAIALALGATPTHPDWWRYLLGGAVAATVLTIPVFIYGPEKAGIGDVKLAFLAGLILGFSLHLYWAFFIAFAAGALAGGLGILLGKLQRKSTLPFGAFLALGTLLVLFLRV